VIGVDDFSVRRGRKAATIIVDLERHRPIELLPDCSASGLARWLETHPSAQTISRDGAREYARGIALGAPDAVQVADRWHLLKNLREVLERVLERERKLLRVRGQSSEEAHNEARSTTSSVPTPPGPTVKRVAVAGSAETQDWSNTRAPPLSRSEG
jgi:transposase